VTLCSLELLAASFNKQTTAMCVCVSKIKRNLFDLGEMVKLRNKSRVGQRFQQDEFQHQEVLHSLDFSARQFRNDTNFKRDIQRNTSP